MARSSILFACSACGHESPKWHGRCPGCGEWNTFVEEQRAAAPAGRPARSGKAVRPVALADVEAGRRGADEHWASGSSTACSAAASCRDRSC